MNKVISKKLLFIFIPLLVIAGAYTILTGSTAFSRLVELSLFGTGFSGINYLVAKE